MEGQKIDLGRNLFAIAFIILRRNWQTCAAATLLLLAANASIGFVVAPLAFAVIRMLLLVIVGYSAYRVLLGHGAFGGWSAIATAEGRLPWRYAGVMLMILSPVLFLGVILNAPSPASATGAGEINLGQIGFSLAMVVIYTVLYVVLGTALPKVAETGQVSLSEAARRGRRHFREISRSLLIGVWLFRAASMLLMMALNYLGVTTDFSVPGAGDFNAAALGPMLLFNFSHIFAECLNATVLMRAYRRFPVDDVRGEIPEPAPLQPLAQRSPSV